MWNHSLWEWINSGFEAPEGAGKASGQPSVQHLKGSAVTPVLKKMKNVPRRAASFNHKLCDVTFYLE